MNLIYYPYLVELLLDPEVRLRLSELIRGLEIIEEDYFYPLRIGRRLRWLRLSREKIDEQTFKEPGILETSCKNTLRTWLVILSEQTA
jgi:hypothetical protein